MSRRDIDEMSFAFRVERQEWNDDYTERRITELALFDVSIVTFPANPATVMTLRDDSTVGPGGYSLSLALAELALIELNEPECARRYR